MSQGVYEILALAARYAFAALMLLIVIRAWRITLVDSRRAAQLRRMSPQTGLSGELVVMVGDEKARRGMRYPVIREGMIGASRRADVRIRHSSVRRRHAYFELTEDGLKVRSHAGAPLRDVHNRPVKEITLRDGGMIGIGRVRLLLVLTGAPEEAVARVRREKRARQDEPFAADPDRMFREHPLLRHEADPNPINPDELFNPRNGGDDW